MMMIIILYTRLATKATARLVRRTARLAAVDPLVALVVSNSFAVRSRVCLRRARLVAGRAQRISLPLLLLLRAQPFLFAAQRGGGLSMVAILFLYLVANASTRDERELAAADQNHARRCESSSDHSVNGWSGAGGSAGGERV